MKKIMIALALSLAGGLALAADKVPAHPHILVETTTGNIKLELEGKLAPITVGHFLKLVDSGFYDGLIFHRVIPGFMAQAGGYTPGLELKEDDATIPNESGNGMSNVRGTIAMARTNDPHSANTQFFINVADNVRLDPANNREFVPFLGEQDEAYGLFSLPITSVLQVAPGVVLPGVWRDDDDDVCFNVSADGTRLTAEGSQCPGGSSLALDLKGFNVSGLPCDVTVR